MPLCPYSEASDDPSIHYEAISAFDNERVTPNHHSVAAEVLRRDERGGPWEVSKGLGFIH